MNAQHPPSIRHIAVMLSDELDAPRALEEALGIARAHEAKLTVLAPAGDLSGGLNSDELSEDVRRRLKAEVEKRRDQHLQGLMEKVRSQHADVDCQLLAGRHWHQAVLNWQEQHPVDLMIKDLSVDSHRRSHLFTPLDWHLLRGTRSALLIVGAQTQSGPVVAAVDLVAARDKPLSLDGQVLRWSRWLSDLRQRPLHVAHAFETVENLRLPFGFDRLMPESDLKAVRAEHQALLDRVSESIEVPPSRRHLLESPPGRAIPELCREQAADTLVLGTVRRGRLERMVLGSTAESIIHALDGDLLAIPPSETDAGQER
ncbi:universal stress protein E [Natronospira proteinivora]|uniref:Universal stress protein E n=1 Tax=Natronospira proteinivora TaxID=1807133 RepID=A0ABT1G7M2_9GAMM|nr:universal stress protein [Natronospira proteinivora]MCP1727304.1 universal stress protein E [Natronospira proteinivora]